MESRQLRADDVDMAKELLRKVYREAAARFSDAWGNNNYLSGHVFEGGGNTGVQVNLAFEDFTVSYISFENDPGEAVIGQLEKNISQYMENSETESLFVNINGENKAIIQHVEKGPFRKDKEGLEYTFSGRDWIKARLPEGITTRGFEDEGFDDYIWLLDSAYRPLLVEDGLMLDPHRRNVKRTYDILKSANESGDFMTYWRDDSIVGLYLIRGNIILDLAVTPVYQRTGIGSAMLSDVLALLIGERGYDTVLLYVSGNNTGARRLYEGMGFKQSASHADFTHVPPSE